MPDSAARARFLTERRVMILGVYLPMWFLGGRVVRQHSSVVPLVPLDPLGSIMLSTSNTEKDYVKSLHQGGVDSLCLPCEDFVVGNPL